MDKNFNSDLINAMSELRNVSGNKINPHFKSKYVTLDALLDAIKPTLHKYNLALIQCLVTEPNLVGVKTSFVHASGSSQDFGTLMVGSTNLDAQKLGSALTYLRRQSLQAACGISIDLDDDGSLASKTQNPTDRVLIKK